ncbi:MAG: hypothetical protein R6U11_10190 [Bacteroidales bacterium]
MDLFSIMSILGIINLVLVLFQLFTGMRMIKIPFSIHKIAGITLSITAITHAFLALYFNYM